MFKYLKRLDSLWPVEVALGDVGHSRAQNKPDTWHKLNNEAFQWLQSHIDGSHEERTARDERGDGVRRCRPAGEQASGRHSRGAGEPDHHVPAPARQHGRLRSEPPIRTGRQRTRSSVPRSSRARPAASPTGPPWAATPPTRRRSRGTETYVGIGHVRGAVRVGGGGDAAMLAARLFDVAPDGTELLITRGAYRLENEPEAGVLRMPLLRQPLAARPGHRIRLDLTQVDSPTYRLSNVPSTISFPSVTLMLPTREAGDSACPRNSVAQSALSARLPPMDEEARRRRREEARQRVYPPAAAGRGRGGGAGGPARARRGRAGRRRRG